MERVLEERALAMIQAVCFREHAYRHRDRVWKLAAILAEHPDAVVEQCGDERTGRRYGRAVVRRGRCQKIGNCAFSPHYHGDPYQLWAVWS